VPDVLSRRYALLGWAVWKLAKRRLRKKLHAEGDVPRRATALRGVVAVAALAALAAVWSKRSHASGDAPGDAPG
jgi:hypothetical protein